MKILHLVAGCGLGGIETLCKSIFEYSKEDNFLITMFSEGINYEHMKKMGYKVFSTKNYNKKANKIVKYIYNFVIKEKINIIIIHNDRNLCNLIYISLYCKLKNKNIKFIRYFHGIYEKGQLGITNNFIKNIITNMFIKKAIDISDELVFISNASKRSIEKKFNIENKKSLVNYNGIPESFYKNTPERNKELKKITICYVGRIAKVKGIDILIKAFKRCDQNKYHLIIVGDGEEKDNLKELSKKLKIYNNIEFKKGTENVIQYLDESNIFVYPSIWNEGFGISIIEAMARKCIPVTFKKGGMTEIIKNNENGYLVDNVDDIALSKTIKNVEFSERIYNNVYNTAKKFKINETVKRLENSYKEI